MLYIRPHFMENLCKLMSFCSVLGDTGLSLYSHQGPFSVQANYSHWQGTRRKASGKLQCRCHKSCIASFYLWNIEMRRGLGRKPPVLVASGLGMRAESSWYSHCRAVVREQRPHSFWAHNYTSALLLWWRLIWLSFASFDVNLILIGLLL